MDTVVFRTSRAKLLPAVLVFPIFPLVIIMPLWFLGKAIAEGKATMGEEAIFTIVAIMLLLFALGEAVGIRRLVQPDTLTLTKEGLAIRRPFRSWSARWENVGEPRKVFYSTGKTGSYYIELPLLKQDAARPLLIPASTYIQPIDTVLAAVGDAWAGRALRQPPETTPKLYAFVLVALMTIAMLMLLSAVWLSLLTH